MIIEHQPYRTPYSYHTAPPAQYRVMPGGAEVRSGPGAHYDVIGELAEHELVTGTVARREEWVEIGPGRYVCKRLDYQTYLAEFG